MTSPTPADTLPKPTVSRRGDGLLHHHYVSLDWRDALIVAVINLMWGLNLIAIKMASTVMGPLTAAMMRQALVLIACVPALRIIRRHMKALLLLGALSGGIFYICVNLSMGMTNNIAALAIAGQLGAPFSIILGVIVLKEQMGLWRIMGMVLAFAGVALLVFRPGGADDLDAMMLTVLASAIWACCSLIQRQLAGVSVLTIYAWIGLIGTAILLPLVMIVEPAHLAALPDLPIKAYRWVAFCAFGSTLIGQGGMSWLLQRHPISTVAPLTLLTPIVAVTASSLYFDTPITLFMVIGGGLAIAGVAIVTLHSAWERDNKR